MAAKTRVYLVTSETHDRVLVRATHPSHALMHVASDMLRVRVASQDDLISAIHDGIEVETIKAEQAELPTD